MADRRCFTKKITESDAFLEMPVSTQALYFHLNMNACDDDGFVNSPKKVARMVGASEDDLRLLILKNFVIAFDTGVIVIKHWRMHNSLRNDRYHPTDYQEEFKQLGLKDNGSYTLSGNQVATDWQPLVSEMETEHNLTKHNITKHNLTKHKYGQYNNVLLTDEDMEKLKNEFPRDWEERVERLSEYVASTGKSYKNHLATIRAWARKDKPAKKEEELPTYEDFVEM